MDTQAKLASNERDHKIYQARHSIAGEDPVKIPQEIGGWTVGLEGY